MKIEDVFRNLEEGKIETARAGAADHHRRDLALYAKNHFSPSREDARQCARFLHGLDNSFVPPTTTSITSTNPNPMNNNRIHVCNCCNAVRLSEYEPCPECGEQGETSTPYIKESVHETRMFILGATAIIAGICLIGIPLYFLIK